MKLTRALAVGVTAAVAIAGLAGCSASSGSGDGKTTIELWTPQAGSPEVEVQNMQNMLDAFTKDNPEYEFDYKTYPFDSYATTVQGAVAAGNLPCMLAVDAPNAPAWAWAGWLQPLTVPASVTDPLIPGAKGVYQDEVYSVGYWDAGLAMFGRPSVLEAHGIRVPTVDDPWTEDEFNGALATLKADPAYKYPLSLGSADIYSGTPFLWSFGGDIVDRDTYLSSDGTLNGPESVKYFTWLQGLVDQGYIASGTTEGNPFQDGSVALYWDGNWDAQSSIDTFGDDIAFLPAPDFGDGTKVGAGSFGYGTSTNCSDSAKEGVNKFLEFSLSTDNLVTISDTQLVIPATADAAAASANYSAGKPLEPFAQLEADHSVIRPATPGFPVMADIYNKATADILAGADVQSTLDQAAKDIDADIKANDGYGFN